MAREYRRIRALPDPPLGVAEPVQAPDYRAYAVAAGGSILAGFVMFAALVFGLYDLFYQIIPSMTVARTASMTAVVGTVELLEPGSTRWVLAQPSMDISEGDVVRTGANSRALVTFFDQSTATLYPLSQVTFNQLRTNRFGKGLRSEPRTIIDVRETAGRALLGVAHLNPVASTSFTVRNGEASAALDEGSFIAKISPTGAFDVAATRGSSTVSDPQGKVTISGGERTEVRAGQAPDSPILAPEDLVSDGAFTQAGVNGFPAGWQQLSPAPEAGDVPGAIRLASDGSAAVIRFTRTKSTYHAEQSIVQTINQDVTDYGTVRLELRFKVFSQSISGGGDQGSEYPLMVRVNYLDASGAQQFFVRGFYVQNSQNLPVTNGQQVPAGQWVDLSGEQGIALQQISPPPHFIQSVQILASGHDYDSEIQKVSLVID